MYRNESLRTPLLRYAVSIALLSCSAAHAANWEIAPRVEGGYRYSDNYRLDQPGNEIDVSGAEADAQVRFRTLDPRRRFEVTPRIRATYFPDDKDEDSTDYYLDGLFEDSTQRRRMGIDVGLAHEDVIRSEFPEPDAGGDLGTPLVGDAGRVTQHNTRNLIQAAPYFRYDFTQRLQIQLDAHFLDSDYDKEFINAQQDYSDYGAAVGLGFTYSPRSALTVRTFGSQYETGFDSKAYGAEFEWSTRPTENSRIYARLGGQQTEPDDGESETTVIGGVGGRWDSPRNTVFVDLTRSVGPIAAGTIIERYQLRVNVDYDLSERTSLQFGLRGSHDQDVGDRDTYPTRKYASAAAGVEWRWLRSLAFTATYNYFFQEYEDEPSDATANSFLIGLVYEPRRQD